jgi:hypothetical protein
MATKKKAPPAGQTLRFDQKKEVRAIARERVGTVKPGRPIQPKSRRKRPKYRESLDALE